MRDSNLQLTDVVTVTAFAANALNLDSTPAEGVWVQLHITKTGVDADERLDAQFYGKDVDSAWATTDMPLCKMEQVGSGLATGAVKILYALIATKLNFVKPQYVTSGLTPGFTVVCSIVSGPDQKQTAALN